MIGSKTSTGATCWIKTRRRRVKKLSRHVRCLNLRTCRNWFFRSRTVEIMPVSSLKGSEIIAGGADLDAGVDHGWGVGVEYWAFAVEGGEEAGVSRANYDCINSVNRITSVTSIKSKISTTRTERCAID